MKRCSPLNHLPHDSLVASGRGGESFEIQGPGPSPGSRNFGLLSFPQAIPPIRYVVLLREVALIVLTCTALISELELVLN